MRKFETKVIDEFYCHVENGGLFVTLEIEGDGPQFLVGSWSHYGNAGPQARMPLLSMAQIDGMIRLLEKAKAGIQEHHSYALKSPEFYSDEKLKDILR